MTERGDIQRTVLERLFPETAKRSLAMRLIYESQQIDGISAAIGITGVGQDGVCEKLVFLAEGTSCVKDETLGKWLRTYDRICRSALQRAILKQPEIMTQELWALVKTADDSTGRQFITIWEREQRRDMNIPAMLAPLIGL
ncbi:hypothetical protein A2696_01355 [Candidatus Curtissbacteria bacterium RIFCSPHIGHO2_01_FULL_41_13]|uniref:Uncharacterized protein n=1 Tax=Candidatus Curtissbacteria bacterium RIFCSPHIGHO2_01_FULL_41_13 TaxID=1797745 RepID=A0A1F5FXY8_9BACT|nr:MAG: hypothetical protein A2696_01355 [Candidatus Curtissbacteria bacterium RIFCSPHIGHO2_01_FULL_41_13]